MRIYNAKNSSVDLPLIGKQRISIGPHSVSGDFLGTTEFISMIVTSYDTNELAFIVSGPYELNVCANVPTATNYVVQSLDEALIKFNEGKKEEDITNDIVCDDIKVSDEELQKTCGDSTKKEEPKVHVKKSLKIIK